MGELTLRLPDIGEGIAEAEIVEWRVSPGDRIVEGDAMVEVMTDKATVELPAPVSGVVEWLGAGPGEMIAVGGDLIGLRTDGPDDAGPGGAARVEVEPAGAPRSRDDRTDEHRPGRALAAPAVRRRALRLGIDLGNVEGSGPDGRVEHEDLDGLLSAGSDTKRVEPASSPLPVGANPFADRRRVEEVEAVPVTGLRRRIASHMGEAWQRIPHFGYVEEVDVTELQRTRSVLGREWGGDHERIGLLPFLMRATVLAVSDHPEVNATFDDDAGVVQRHRRVHLGIAVQTEHGLVVTVVRDAQARDVRSCADEVARLSAAARSGSATLSELRGSTITITNLGALGGVVSSPIIHHPEVAIIGVNKVVERPVCRDGEVVVREMMNLSSSFDHRVLDGWDAARFVQRVRQLIETPALLLDG